MADYAIDAATLLHIVGERIEIDPAHRLVAPNSIRSHALATLLAAVRDGALDEREALARHERMTELKLRLLGDRVSRRTAWNLARQHGWELAECEYLAVAKLQAEALATVDAAFAAKVAAIVPTTALSTLTVDASGAPPTS